MEIWSILERAVALFPDQVAVVDGDRQVTYVELGERTARLARFLQASGLQAGDRVSIIEVNSLHFLEAYFAVAAVGAILNPLNHRLSPRELELILEDAGSRWLLAGPRFEETVSRVAGRVGLEGVGWLGPPTRPADLACPALSLEHELAALAGCWPLARQPVSPDEVAQLYYTSGTTGRPKGVMLTHRNVCVHALAAVAELQLVEGDVWGHIAPMFHLADAWATFALTWVGGRHVMVPAFSAGAALAAIEEQRVTVSNLIPTMLNLMVKDPGVDGYDLSSLRLVLSGGAPIAPALVGQVMQTFGCEYVQTYGMTETSPYLTLSTPKSSLLRLPPERQLAFRARTGRPFLTVELCVVDEEGAPVAADDRQVGEIWARGETVTPGYWRQPEATRAAFAPGGWLRTGDLATVDREGYVNIVDRKKDMIICGGENVYCVEVEHVLYAHPSILEVAVFGVPDETWGEIVWAAAVLRPGEQTTADELIAFCRERLAGYKTPRGVTFLDALPKTGSGKIQKALLRDAHRSRG